MYLHAAMENNSKSVLTFYVKLYCKRKFNTEPKGNQIEEATKSWLTLSDVDKNYFKTKLEERKASYKSKFADYLRNSKPYLRKKYNRTDIQIFNKANTNETLQENVTQEETELEAFQAKYGNEKNNLIIYDSFTKTEEKFHEQVQSDFGLNSNVGHSVELENFEICEGITEPIPPNVKNGKELFEIIKTTNEEERNWSTLTLSEQRRYQTIVLSLKRDYLRKYKAYLESLPSEKLFHHYNTKI